jgi:hypothetical protein
MHEMLLGQGPLADKVHCAYVVHSELADAGQSHVTWAHGELLDRVVSPVSRRNCTWEGCACSALPRLPSFPK